MSTFLSILLAVFVVAIIALAFAALITRRRKRHAHEKLDEKFIYRKEPHADQLTEKPNKLSDNEITKG